KLPLLIGGATTSKIHTAIKIEPHYDPPVVHVLDASKSVSTVSSLIGGSEESRKTFVEGIREEYAAIRERRKNTGKKRFVTIEQARENHLKLDWQNYTPVRPQKLGIQVFKEIDFQEIREYIDWTPYFQSWQLKGKFPEIFEDEFVGDEARKVYNDALGMLDRIITEKWLSANAVIGFFPAQSEGDKVYVYEEDGKTVREELVFLRQQVKRAKGI